MKRILAMLLTLLLCLSQAAPLRAGAAEPALESWAAIRRIEARLDAAGPQSEAARSAAYAGAVEQLIRAVETAPDTLPGSLERHGDFFFWRSADGRANGYSPSLRAELRTRRADAPAAVPEELPAPDSLLLEGESGNTSSSRDVGVLVPYSGSYYFYPEKAIAEGRALARSTGGQLHVHTAETANVDNLARLLEDCGLVLINSHGRTDYEAGQDHTSRANSSYICLPSFEGVTQADQQPVTGPYGTYYHAFYAGPSDEFDEDYYCVDGTCVSRHMQKDAPHSMVWMGFCLGMATEGFCAPLRERGVEALLGFTERVITTTDQGYRAVFGQALLEDADVAGAVARMKAEIGCPDPVDVGHEPAWPVLVSSQDPYPGREHLTEGQTVCSDWKLYPAYPISVTVEPAGSAQAELLRHKLTVVPARGWRFADWEITQGEASAERQGNLLDFALSGPCAVTLYMEARTPARLCFSAGPGQSAPEIAEFVGDSVILPAPQGELEADAYVYHFLGWTREDMAEDRETAPALLTPGTRLTLTEPELCLRAVYGYFAAEDPENRGQFRRVTEAPADWAGDYVLTYQSTKALMASSRHTGQGITSPAAVAASAAGAYYIDGDWLNEVPEELVYSFLPGANGAGPLKMKGSENYLAVPSSTVMLSTVGDPAAQGAAWRMKWTGETVQISNAKYTARILQYSPTSSGFCTLTVLRGPLTLYARVPGQHLYTLNPVSAQPEPPVHEHSWGEWQETVAPGCGTEGEKTRICTGCGGVESRSLPALGHDWGEPVYRWSPDDTAVTAERLCLRDGSHRETETAPSAAELLLAPTTEAEGAIRYTAVFENPAFLPQTKTLVLPRLEEPEPQLPCDGGADCPGRAFADMPPKGHWAHDALDWALAKGVSAGSGEGLIGPGGVCTRAQLVSFLWRAAGSPEPASTELPFTDVRPNTYYAKPVLWALEQGLCAGTGAGRFSPGAPCTREQAVCILWRFAGSPEPERADCPFEDVQAGRWYWKAVRWAAESGVSAGLSADRFGLGEHCTRAQILCFLWRWLCR